LCVCVNCTCQDVLLFVDKPNARLYCLLCHSVCVCELYLPGRAVVCRQTQC